MISTKIKLVIVTETGHRIESVKYNVPLLTSFFTILDDSILSTIAASSSLGFSYVNEEKNI
jgi:hypothetical protein